MALNIDKYGIREVCDLKFYKIDDVIGEGKSLETAEPVFVIDSAKTSTLEGAATTVYAQGGRGNPRLIAWEGEKTLTFTVEDALISKEGLEVLTGDKDTAADGVIDISPNNFAGYYYVTAESLMRQEDNGEDYPITITLPRVKIQSNFSISMAPTGDPSTFSYVMDAFPGYINADDKKEKKVKKKLLCRMKIEDNSVSDIDEVTVSNLSSTGLKIAFNTSIDLDKSEISAQILGEENGTHVPTITSTGAKAWEVDFTGVTSGLESRTYAVKISVANNSVYSGITVG